MATAETSTFSHYDRRGSADSDDTPLTTTTDRFASNSTRSSSIPRPGQHLDDADLLAWKHQYINIGLREQSVLSNSADDVTQLDDQLPYPIERFNQGYAEGDDDELHFDDGNTFDYGTSIQERLKRANEELKQDEMPLELKHRQRVSFDAVVRAVDFGQDPQESTNSNPTTEPVAARIVEDAPSRDTNNSSEEPVPHEYTVPLNDTQPREGPSMLDKIKAVQFHGAPPPTDTWSSTSHPPTVSEDLSSATKTSSNSMDNQETSQPNSAAAAAAASQKPMVVSINGEFQLQDEDDYTAKRERSLATGKTTFVPSPPSDPKPKQDSLKPQRPTPSLARPTSSDSSRRTTHSTSKSFSGSSANQQRPKSAGVSSSIQTFYPRPSAGIDFVALNRKTAAEKRAKEEKERREKEKAKEERRIQLEKAKESFEKWMQEKDAERRRINEEKRLEKEEHDVRQAKCEKELGELREKKYHDWLERKNREITLANEFKKLQADDEDQASGGGSSSSIAYSQQRENKRAFQRWLRQKYEQGKEERRQLRLESRRLRRRQRRSIKRYQLQQDLQLAKAFGYS